ncbi:MAG: toxin-antitoxin (TA) system antitoxin [Acidobacteriota bacterium]|nr:toxin-antitoxin (TA) system antitoxin [Acidobacteriota bacterium]
MTKTLSINEVSMQTIISLTRNGDEIVLEENGEPLAKVTPIEKPQVQKPRIAGLGRGTMWMSEDFDDELPDEFWNFDKEL